MNCVKVTEKYDATFTFQALVSLSSRTIRLMVFPAKETKSNGWTFPR